MKPTRNQHAVHRGFVSTDERERMLELARLVGPDDAPRFREYVWRALCEWRAGTPLPVPTFTFLRDEWDLSHVVACDLVPFQGGFDEKPEQQNFVSREERSRVLRNALSQSTHPEDVRTVTYDAVWRYLVVERAGTMLAIPSYKMVRNAWCAAIEDEAEVTP